ncbi:MAG: SMC family ATPase [Actinomycetota bacterium]|nr:SMC family ATPase [Actinomycetota bacterium]MDQ6945996.1 SMC family ATPase [Actinomycetota bacterium]
MLLNRIYLRNFRVYEDELDLDIPPGLVGIYGPNGAGKSTLLEAIVFALWGRARTAKNQIRSSGVGGDCVAEVSFEHEGHLFIVRRTLSGINATIRAEAHADGLVMATGVRETGRYIHSVLGMDDVAFRASVFAEQKQLAAFSTQSPAERRRLVLQLLGITPLDAARDAARRDARATTEQHRRLRELLADLDVLAVAADDAEARAAAAETTAETEEATVEVHRSRAEEAAATVAVVETGKQAYDALVAEGRSARADMERASGAVKQLATEADELEAAAARLVDAERRSKALEPAETRFAALSAVLDATRAVDALVVAAEPPPPDQTTYDGVVEAAAAARDALASVKGRTQAAAADVERARQQAERSAALSNEADCPLCGQALGAAFESVQAHRATELAEATARLGALSAEQDLCQEAATTTAAALGAATADRQRAETVRAAWEQTSARRTDALSVLERARATVSAGVDLPHDAGALDAQREEAVAARKAARAATIEAERLRGRLERRQVVAAGLITARAEVDQATGRVEELLRRVKELDFDPARLAAARATYDEAAARTAAADRVARQARLAATQERTRAEGEARRLADATEQHATLATLQTDARHLSRLGDLLAEFRNTVVASVGPRLALQAAELFGELTDHDYDELRVDPETYELQISDGGRVFGLDRFSGSEVDLANLALRVAISEHVRFQSGGSVGLLVLDEVFGPLDQERKTRMLEALERLKGRFRQVLVVTHDNEIKDQLPNAIEVVKLPGRRATARLVGT